VELRTRRLSVCCIHKRHSQVWTSCFPELSSEVLEAIMDARVLDYIDDRLATSSDFEALDSLIENVKEQQDLLKRQVTNIRLGESHT
jgi:hypothetical protein